MASNVSLQPPEPLPYDTSLELWEEFSNDPSVQEIVSKVRGSRPLFVTPEVFAAYQEVAEDRFYNVVAWPINEENVIAIYDPVSPRATDNRRVHLFHLDPDTETETMIAASSGG